jgi:hypothetical protein
MEMLPDPAHPIAKQVSYNPKNRKRENCLIIMQFNNGAKQINNTTAATRFMIEKVSQNQAGAEVFEYNNTLRADQHF